MISRPLDVPIVGTGGVASGADAMEMIMAGATAVGIGSVLELDGDGAFLRIQNELSALMIEMGIRSLADIRGCAHV
jgi:dihydroorotate dehydrogenase